MPDPKDPTEPHRPLSDLKYGESAEDAQDAPLQNEYTGDAQRDGIPANGTKSTEATGPDDIGA